VTGLLSTCGLQFQDWTAAYRLFARNRINMSRVFDVVRNEAVAQLPAEVPLSIAMDDSLLRKTGTHIHGVAWRRDPLGPPFQTNFIRAQRVLQLSLALPCNEGTSSAKLVPIDFAHVPTAPKPRHDAPPEAWTEYKSQQKLANISLQAVSRLKQLSENLKNDPSLSKRSVYLLVDGRFTNRAVFKGLPQGMLFIGRIRSDAKLYAIPSPDVAAGRGRRRSYGEELPTPEQLRQDKSVPWNTVRVLAAGREHDFRIKSLSCVLWRAAGAKRLLRLVVIAPLGYRPRKNSKILYRKPAYLITTDVTSDLSRIVQNYVWRWGIEVNFREEKTLLGVGQAQVRIPASTGNVPAMIVASYAMLLLAALRNRGTLTAECTLPSAKWCRPQSAPVTTQSLINQLRVELWAKALGIEKLSKFSSSIGPDQKPEKLRPSLPSAVLYAAA
jgi:hypothetical protein